MVSSRREFLGRVGNGMLIAGLGASLSSDLGITTVEAGESDRSIDFGPLEPLAALMQETAPSELIAQLVGKLKEGLPLETLVAAGALANARAFGGEDYIGFHTFMALVPALRMAKRMTSEKSALPVLKVLHRNSVRMHEVSQSRKDVLKVLEPIAIPENVDIGEHLRSVARRGDIELADRVFGSLANHPLQETFNYIQPEMEDETDVHRVVLAWRAWDTYELAGEQWGHCLLRQSIRYCTSIEKRIIDSKSAPSTIREQLPKLLDQYKLDGRELGTKAGDDIWTSELATVLFRANRNAAADAVAQAITDGYSPESIGEAISIASNWLVLHDPGRPQEYSSSDKPLGSCHGDSVGVHASDSANAWRNIVRVSNRKNVIASLIVAAFHTGGQSNRSNKEPYPYREHLAEVKSNEASQLLGQLNEAIQAKDQFLAAAVAQRYGQLGHSVDTILDELLRYAISEDGSLHAEKYFHTACMEFHTTRPSYRWNQITALARVTASEFGNTSTGYLEAKSQLGL